MRKIIFTDLDGCLIDDKYSFEKASESLSLMKKKKIPLILCSSKTRAEMEYYQGKIGVEYPFICENGSAIIIPGENVIVLGEKIENIQPCLDEIRRSAAVKGFNEFSDEEVAQETGLPLDQAKMAMQRRYSLPFIVRNHDDISNIRKIIKKHNLFLTKGGLFYTIIGKTSKGKAIRHLIPLLEEHYGPIYTIGIGDAPNDFEMLDIVDKAYLIMSKDGSYSSQDYEKSEAYGPEGWNRIVLKEITK